MDSIGVESGENIIQLNGWRENEESRQLK